MLAMKEKVTVDKKEYEVAVKIYECFEELILNETAEHIVAVFNYRNAQIQKIEAKKRLKPKKLSIKERRRLAFNSLSKGELKKIQGNAVLFESLLEKKMKELENVEPEGPSTATNTKS